MLVLPLSIRVLSKKIELYFAAASEAEVVTRKGERFIKINVSLDPGPGCQIGGVMGWRTKMGRRGLGIKKMTKERFINKLG